MRCGVSRLKTRSGRRFIRLALVYRGALECSRNNLEYWTPHCRLVRVILLVNVRIAILGLFNSGSTALAGVLHQLGVNMGGPPFFKEFYESAEIARNLRRWWSEPELVETVVPDTQQ